MAVLEKCLAHTSLTVEGVDMKVKSFEANYNNLIFDLRLSKFDSNH